MKREIQEPVATETTHGGTRFTHPAFATIGASRVHGGDQVLFGTDFKHNGFLTITIRRADLTRELSRDWIHGGDEIIEVMLSEAQWAHFVSTPNQGSGTACTINHVMGKRAPEIPYRNSTEAFTEEVAEDVRNAIRKIDEAIADVREIAETIPKKKAEAMLAKLAKARQEIVDNMPFVVRQFGKHMENTVEKAKIEVNAYAQDLFVRAGVAALKGGAQVEPPIRIESGESRGSEA